MTKQLFYLKDQPTDLIDDNPYPEPRWAYNQQQQARAECCLPPLDNFCNESEPGQIFECECCSYLRPYSRGCDDEHFDICDHCWGRLEAPNLSGKELFMITAYKQKLKRRESLPTRSDC